MLSTTSIQETKSLPSLASQAALFTPKKAAPVPTLQALASLATGSTVEFRII